MDYQTVDAVYSWVRTSKNDGTRASVFFPLFDEDTGKREAIYSGSKADLIPLIAGMLGIASGKAELEDEDLLTAMLREIEEEWNEPIAPEQLTNGLPHIEVLQERGDRVFLLRGTGFQVQLTAEQTTRLQEKFGVVILDDDELRHALEQEPERFRPFVRHVAELLLNDRRYFL